MTAVITDADLVELREQGLSAKLIASRTGVALGAVQYRIDRLKVPPVRCALCPRFLDYRDRRLGRNLLLSRDDFCSHCARPTTQRGEHMSTVDGWIAFMRTAAREPASVRRPWAEDMP